VIPPRLELRGVGHAYGARVVLAGVERVLEPGRSLGLLGPNGSGKSTLLRCIAGLLRPRAGQVLVDGRNSCELAPAERSRVAYAGHRPLLWGGLSARENLMLCAGLYGIDAGAADAALAAAGLEDHAGIAAASLSQGQRQRLALARALLPQPALLVLDEPHSGLDEASSARLDALLEETRGTVTLILATHELARAERLCDELMSLEVLR
jgi:heme ABC exporter ATP-binding subunit CcmA